MSVLLCVGSLMALQKIFFLIQSAGHLPHDELWLAPGEARRAAEMRFAKRRGDWILGRWTVKSAIRAFFILHGQAVPEFADLEIRSAADGAPEACLRGTAASVSITLSHSGGQGFCAVAAAGITIGCDLEVIQPHDARFMDDYMLPDEGAAIARAPLEQQPLITTLIWSAKESALKCLREGLRRDTRSVRIEIADARTPGWNPFTAHCLQTGRLFYGWWRPSGSSIQTISSDAATAEPVPLATMPFP